MEGDGSGVEEDQGVWGVSCGQCRCCQVWKETCGVAWVHATGVHTASLGLPPEVGGWGCTCMQGGSNTSWLGAPPPALVHSWTGDLHTKSDERWRSCLA